jgi:hypothetical protein
VIGLQTAEARATVAGKALAGAEPGTAAYPTPGEFWPQHIRRPALSGSDQAATTAASGPSPSYIPVVQTFHR